jgi:hypothetical protein
MMLAIEYRDRKELFYIIYCCDCFVNGCAMAVLLAIYIVCRDMTSNYDATL